MLHTIDILGALAFAALLVAHFVAIVKIRAVDIEPRSRGRRGSESSRPDGFERHCERAHALRGVYLRGLLKQLIGKLRTALRLRA